MGAIRLSPMKFSCRGSTLDEMDDAGIDDAILVGHSYDGGVALTAAALAPMLPGERGIYFIQLTFSGSDLGLNSASWSR
jgi:hypothetical protein